MEEDEEDGWGGGGGGCLFIGCVCVCVCVCDCVWGGAVSIGGGAMVTFFVDAGRGSMLFDIFNAEIGGGRGRDEAETAGTGVG